LYAAIFRTAAFLSSGKRGQREKGVKEKGVRVHFGKMYSDPFILLHITRRILDFVEALHGVRDKAGGQT